MLPGINVALNLRCHLFQTFTHRMSRVFEAGNELDKVKSKAGTERVEAPGAERLVYKGDSERRFHSARSRDQVQWAGRYNRPAS